MNDEYGYYQAPEPGEWVPPVYEEPEHYFLGALGAIGGALIGVAAILLIGLAGFVASFCGVVMAVCALKGYEMLAKKMSVKGVVITSVVLVVMTLFAQYMDWTIDFYRAYTKYYDDVSFGLIFWNLPYMIAQVGEGWRFLLDFGILGLFTALGAGPRVRQVMAEQKQNQQNM